MVLLRGPLFSISASGTLADCLIYQTINTAPVVRSLRFPTYSNTPEQEVIRSNFSWAVDTWIALHDPKKLLWEAYENSNHLTGYKAFMDQFLRRTYLILWQFELPPDIGFCVTGNHTTGEFLVGGGYLTPP